ncbi:MAG: hypothetical protein K2W96_14345 [Gemmataceae bacterium]|nr:hypothetical protein [Gemmataceae bacterium]
MQAAVAFAFVRRPQPEHDRLVGIVRETHPRRNEEIRIMAQSIFEHAVEQARPRLQRETLRTVLREDLELRFGTLPPEMLARIAAADEPALRAAIRTIPLLTSLDALKL